MSKHCEDCTHYEKCENCEDMNNHNHNYSNAIRPKEKPEKLLISKELAKGIFQIALTSIEIGGDIENNFITSMKCSGYIEKSELEALVEKVEARIAKIEKNTAPNEFFRFSEIDLIEIKNVIKALIKDHPEYKK